MQITTVEFEMAVKRTKAADGVSCSNDGPGPGIEAEGIGRELSHRAQSEEKRRKRIKSGKRDTDTDESKSRGDNTRGNTRETNQRQDFWSTGMCRRKKRPFVPQGIKRNQHLRCLVIT